MEVNGAEKALIMRALSVYKGSGRVHPTHPDWSASNRLWDRCLAPDPPRERCPEPYGRYQGQG